MVMDVVTVRVARVASAPQTIFGHWAEPVICSLGLILALALFTPFFHYLKLFSDSNIHRNSLILLKYIENGIELEKYEINFFRILFSRSWQ
jgi:hypothetical protein